MSHAHRAGDGPAATGDADEERPLAAKVVLMELVEAAGPVAAADLAERTLLSTAAVEAAVSDLAAAGLCTELPGDERRPPRYLLDEASSGSTSHRASAP